MRYSLRSGVSALGVLILALGIWGGIVPFVGPTFGYDMGNTGAWTWTQSHGTLHVAPAIAVVLGALLMIGGTRGVQPLGALLSLVGGIWFVIGPTLEPLWHSSGTAMGNSMSGMMGSSMHHTSTTMQALQGIGYHYGTGVLIATLAALALGLLAPAPATALAAAPEGAVARRPRLRLRTHP